MDIIVSKIAKKFSLLTIYLKKIYAPENRSILVITIMILGTVAGITPLVQGQLKKRTETPLGANNQDAIMAISQPPQNVEFLVLSSERRQGTSLEQDKYSIFPDIPVDSTSFYFKEYTGEMLFETGIFCVDWKKADEKTRKAIVSMQRNGNVNIKKIFASSYDKINREKNIDGLQVYSVNYPLTGRLLFSSYGNSLILARNEEALINALIAIKYSTTRLSWNGGSCQASRTFIDSFKRYHFFLRTSEPGKIRELPHRHVQSLSVDKLRNMAISRADPYGSTRSIYTWLTKKGINRRIRDEKTSAYISDIDNDCIANNSQGI